MDPWPIPMPDCDMTNNLPAALAVALAIIVFPHPGGPWSKTPETRYGSW